MSPAPLSQRRIRLLMDGIRVELYCSGCTFDGKEFWIKFRLGRPKLPLSKYVDGGCLLLCSLGTPSAQWAQHHISRYLALANDVVDSDSLV